MTMKIFNPYFINCNYIRLIQYKSYLRISAMVRKKPKLNQLEEHWVLVNESFGLLFIWILYRIYGVDLF